MKPRRRARPTLADCLFAALLCWLLAYTLMNSPAGLLQDAATGFHIREGQAILAGRDAIRHDVFSFSQPGRPFVALEWLSGVIFALLYHWMNLKGVILFAAVLIALTVTLVLCRMVRLGANALAALLAIHLVIGASSIHFLARPHLFTYLFLAAAFLLLDQDRRQATPWVWALVPLAALWANLHGGFLALLVSLAVLAAGYALEAWLFGRGAPGRWRLPRRYALLTLATMAASCVNPWGPRLLVDLYFYLRQSWMLKMIEEYQPPRFHGGGSLYIEFLVLGAVLAAGALFARRQIAAPLLILAWTHASLLSIRHVPILAIVAGPWIAAGATELWNHAVRRFRDHWAVRSLDAVARDHTPGLARLSGWAAGFLVLVVLVPLGWPTDFPASRFPVGLVGRHAGLIARSRIFATDRWSDYLSFRFYPRQRIFIDGRVGGFFGEKICRDYECLLDARPGWRRLLRAYRIDAVLVPPGAGLARALRAVPGWVTVERTSQAVLSVRAAGGRRPPGATATAVAP